MHCSDHKNNRLKRIFSDSLELRDYLALAIEAHGYSKKAARKIIDHKFDIEKCTDCDGVFHVDKKL